MHIPPIHALLRRSPLWLLAAALPAVAPAQEVAPPRVQIHAPAAPAGVATFFQAAAFSKADLSPSGRHIAVLYRGKEGRVKLVVMDVETLTPAVVAALPDGDVSSFHWVNDARLVFSLGDSKAGQGELRQGPGLYAVNRDGGELRLLVNRRGIPSGTNAKTLLPPDVSFFSAIGKRDGDDIYVSQPSYRNDEADALNLLRLNTVSGHSYAVQRPGKARQWLLDQSGEARICVTSDDNLAAIHYKDPANGNWRQLAQFDAWTGDAIAPLFLSADNVLYVSARQGQDAASLYTFDLGKNVMAAAPLVSTPGYDFGGAILATSKKVLGASVETDRHAVVWFDEDMKTLQRAVDAALPNASNIIRPTFRSETPYLLVTSFSDVDPGSLFLYNTESKRLIPFGGNRGGLDPARMAHKTMVRYAARDGLSIPAYLTLPNGRAAKDLPLVVMVHGGPTVRGGHWQFDPQVQFLASRGYAVLEPDFRGSTGYGKQHERAGWKQWGLAMQDDLADGAKWAVSQGYANPKRICIAGASYGGYATLMGLIKDPEIFRCGIDWVGVTDINLLYSVTWSDSSAAVQKYQLPLWIGDRVKDAAQLAATSPIEQAARLKQPVILAYGGADHRVPIVHGLKFRDALKASNPDVEWIEYAEEGHGWRLLKNNVDFWGRVEKFLDRHIGP